MSSCPVSSVDFQEKGTKILIFFIIDAVKRRTLPAWIREGLEKMEREKQKKLERERMEQQRAQMKQEQKSQDAEGDGPRLPLKSKFVSKNIPDTWLEG